MTDAGSARGGNDEPGRGLADLLTQVDFDSPSLQERYAPEGICFGCGPANEEGLRIRSFPEPDAHDRLVCVWHPQEHHQAFEGVLNGGIIGSLLDCHLNWTASYFLLKRDGLDRAPCTVTSQYEVRMRRPTPIDRDLVLRSRVITDDGPKVEVFGSLSADGVETATGSGTFVAVGPDHPAHHRW